ncbi:CitMHS family transporter [Frigidibacter mobilis]|uniref:CitMHS family citrate/H symporter n=1 Tax=Frigidibacter mobilis TaxID=1335048 RepID=A0A159Z3U5_9RHOB|nr:citrate:proton symporter [Frigidibacter mobilis]AMY68890.1 CitMHS family citrate/H symporter [Frigidibacter mobilis]
MMSLAFLGFATVATFIGLIMTKRLSAMVALIVVPILFGLISGAGPELGEMAFRGIEQVAPIALLLCFAILFFGIMMDAGLFDPLVRRILYVVGNDPMRIALGTTALTAIVSVDGDGTTTAIIVISALLPVYRAVGMSPLILATLLCITNAILNLVPWGGPAARAAIALKVDLMTQIFLPMLPALLLALAATSVLAWYFGRMERARLGWQPSVMVREMPVLDVRPERRPHLFWPNMMLTIVLMAGLFTQVAPLPVLLMGAFAIAITLNYPRLKDQRERLNDHASNVFMVFALIFAAGSFTGILEGTGMLAAMADGLLAATPDVLGPYYALVTALLSLPLTFLMSNDAYYFGIVPVLAEAAAAYGVPADAIARASLVGQPVHQLSPLLAPVYLAAGMLGLEVGELQRFALKFAALASLVLLLAAIATGAIPLVA